jgi:hypothetical protein
MTQDFLIEFHDIWCHECKLVNFNSIYAAMAKELQVVKDLTIGSFDTTVNSYKEVIGTIEA